MLLFVYRSFSHHAAGARSRCSSKCPPPEESSRFLGNIGVIGLSTYATNILTLLVIAAGTDYAIFVVGRYQEARGTGEDRETAFYTMFHGTAHIVLGSGLTVAGAVPVCASPGCPTSKVWASRRDRHPDRAVRRAHPRSRDTHPGRLGRVFEPKRAMRTRSWRRIGTAIVRWPGAVLAAAYALALIGLLALPGYKTSYDDRVPTCRPARRPMSVTRQPSGISPRARLDPELLMIESDHDVRNPADMLILDRVAKDVFHVPGVAQVQTITSR